jgi:hypothetical protein
MAMDLRPHRRWASSNTQQGLDSATIIEYNPTEDSRLPGTHNIHFRSPLLRVHHTFNFLNL